MAGVSGHASCSLQQSGHLGQDRQAAVRSVDLVGVELVEHGGQRGAAGGAGLVGDALRRLGQAQPADAARRGAPRSVGKSRARRFSAGSTSRFRTSSTATSCASS